MKANRTGNDNAPPTIEDLGDGTFYYNFNVVKSKTEDEEDNWDYKQVRCNYPVDQSEIQEKINKLNIDHNVEI